MTAAQILTWLRQGNWGLPPLVLEEVQTAEFPGNLDAIVTFSWQSRRYRFGVEIQRLWTPRAIAQAADQILRNTGIVEVPHVFPAS